MMYGQQPMYGQATTSFIVTFLEYSTRSGQQYQSEIRRVDIKTKSYTLITAMPTMRH